MPQLGNAFGILMGRSPYNKKSVDDSLKSLAAAVKVLEDHLLINTFLVGERITLADLYAAGLIYRGFENFFDAQWREEHPNTFRWFDTIANQQIFKAALPNVKYAEKALPNVPPKKEEKPKAAAPKKQEKKPVAAAAAAADDEEEDKPAPKPKHPLDALPRATFVLDDW